MKRIVYHVMIPAIMPVIFFIVATTPVEVLGCLTRGLIALLIALVSGLAAIGAAIMGIKRRLRGDASAEWWVLSSLVLAVPVVALLIMA